MTRSSKYAHPLAIAALVVLAAVAVVTTWPGIGVHEAVAADLTAAQWTAVQAASPLLTGDPGPIFADGFESGGAGRWSASNPP